MLRARSSPRSSCVPVRTPARPAPASPRRSGGSSVIAADLPVGHGEPPAAQRLRDVVGHRRGDQHLLGVGDQLGELRAPAGVELGEDVVEDQDRVVAVRPAAGRTRPAAARARTTRTRRGWRSPSPACRPGPAAGRRGAARPGSARGRARRAPARSIAASSCLELVQVGSAPARLERRPVGEGRVVPAGSAGDGLVGLADQRVQVLDQPDPARA